jgi:hypothetical protein
MAWLTETTMSANHDSVKNGVPTTVPTALTPILPRYGLYVRAVGKVKGVKRFAVWFRKVWLSLPAEYRDKLLTYWDRRKALPSPRIELTTAAEKLLGFEMRDFALCGPDGHHLQFHPLTLNMPYHVFRAMLAEVFAKVCQSAFEADTAPDGPRPTKNVAFLLWLWGIDSTVVDTWSMYDGLQELRQ